MIKYSELKELFSQLENVRVEEFKAYVEDEQIEPPFIVYAMTNDVSLKADGIVFFTLLSINTLLIVEEMDNPVIKQLEELLTKNSIVYDRNIEYADNDRVFEIMYKFEVQNG